MLSNKIIDYLKSKNWWFDEVTEEYSDTLLDLNIPLSSDFAQFYLHAEDGPTFLSRGIEIYQVCWFMRNSEDLKILMDNLWFKRPLGVLPENFIPFNDDVDGKRFLYDIKTDAVFNVDEEQMTNLIQNKTTPQWSSFNDFLEWYFVL